MSSPDYEFSYYETPAGFILKKFLIDTRTNKNRWDVPWESIKKYGATFIGKPTVLTADGDHPDIDNQHMYSIGNIFRVEYDDKARVAYQYTLVTSGSAQKAIRAHKVKFGSPSIEAYNNDTVKHPDGRITLHKWWANHDAMVYDPAYGDKDRIVGFCEGDIQGCVVGMRDFKAATSDTAIDQITVVPFVRKLVQKRFKSCSIAKKGGIDKYMATLDESTLEAMVESAMLSYLSEKMFN